MTSYLIVNIVFSILVIAGVVSLLAWAIATQHRDHGGREVRVYRRRRLEPRRRLGAEPVRVAMLGQHANES
jgi:hypothetical protein